MAAPMTLSPRCGLCDGQNHLLRCASCKVMFYCSREHQASHRDEHKYLCIAVKKALVHFSAEEKKLLEEPGDGAFVRPYPLQNDVGNFWGIVETRDYMLARYRLANAILKINTFNAVEAAYDHLRDLLRLCRSDNLGVRDQIPSLLLRLHRDQDCYDFIKWWSTTGQDSHYNWGNTDLPYLDIVNANVFEPISPFCWKKNASLSNVTAMTLLKIRLLLDLQDLQNVSTLYAKMPRELVDYTRKFLPRTSIISDSKEIMLSTDHSARIQELEDQIDELFFAVEDVNPYFWPALLEPDDHLDAVIEFTSPGTESEMELVLQFSFHAWMETPGAIEIIKAKMEEP